MNITAQRETLRNNNRSLRIRGSNNPNWKGDDIGYRPLHRYVRRNLPKKEKCEKCGKVKPLEVANISGKYLRDLVDWEWLCRSCHMKSDGRMKNLVQFR